MAKQKVGPKEAQMRAMREGTYWTQKPPNAKPTGGPLSDEEREQFKAREKTILGSLVAFWEVGEALIDIRDRRLYRERHATFEDYCRDRWGIARSRAYQLIGATKTKQEMSTRVDIAALTERQVRELAPLKGDPEAAEAVLAEAAASGEPTAAKIRQAVARRAERPSARRRLCLSFEQEDDLRTSLAAGDASAGLAILDQAG